MKKMRDRKKSYKGENLSNIAYPLGGIGTGMFCIEGTGALSNFSLWHKPDVNNEPRVFSALHVKGLKGGKGIAKLLEGPVPVRKIFSMPGAGNGLNGKTYGLPRFSKCTFSASFPFAKIVLSDSVIPIRAEITESIYAGRLGQFELACRRV